MNNIYRVLLIILFAASFNWAQTYKGPAIGSVTGGVVVSTNSFAKASNITFPTPEYVRNKMPDIPHSEFVDFGPLNKPSGLNYIQDPSLTNSVATSKTILLDSWIGMGQLNSIPPDPHVAAGPDHIVAVVNSRFAIWDKAGNLLENIDADAWFSSTFQGAGPFDPKVSYDHYDNRWIMVWLHQNDSPQESYHLVSVSDDSDPNGTWYNWALPGNVNGPDVVDNWSDYQGVGFDEEALYISSNQFKFGANFQYVKIRIVPKSYLYADSAGSVDWYDIWDITYPQNSSKIFNIRPSVSYTPGNTYHLVHSPSGSGNFMSVYKITDPVLNPVLTASNVPVSAYNTAPNANQLGGSTVLLDVAGSSLRHEPIFRDGFLWQVHTIANPTAQQYSSLHYVKIDVNSNTAVEDFIFGMQGFWFSYPTLSVDKDQNVALTYSRTGDTEYIGAYYATRLKDDPPGFDGSHVLQPGKGNYVVTFSGTRNRWGDYMGIWLDPVDQNNFWLFTEYAAATNNWGTWVGHIRLIPFPGVYLKASATSLNFGDVEINTNSDTLAVELLNLGEDDLVITSIPGSVGSFNLVSDLTFPITLKSYESIFLHFLFAPSEAGLLTEEIEITSNDNDFSKLTLTGNAFKIVASQNDIFYASSGSGNNGNIMQINTLSGEGTNIGPSLFSGLKSIAIHPKTNIMYGISTKADTAEIVRVNAEGGDAYILHKLPLNYMYSLAFDTSGVLYGALRTGEIYTIDLTSGEFAIQCTSKGFISSIAFNPVDNELWASAFLIVGSNKDRIFKIDLATGDTTHVGKTGFNILNNSIAFDKTGNLFGVTGSAVANNNFISIDKITGAGSIIGDIGFKNITDIAMAPGNVTAIENTDNQIPKDFSLKQNYPNPFNPTTSIEYDLPADSRVKLVVYNLLGEIVAELVNSERSAGTHKVTWNAQNLSSGIYFYELKAFASNRGEFSQIRKTILLK